MPRGNLIVRKEKPQRKIISGRATLDGQRGDFKVAVNVQRKEKIVLNSRREPIDVIVTEKISLEDATFISNRTKRKEEARWNDKGKHRSVRVYDEWEDDEDSEVDRDWEMGSRRGQKSSSRSNDKGKHRSVRVYDEWEDDEDSEVDRYWKTGSRRGHDSSSKFSREDESWNGNEKHRSVRIRHVSDEWEDDVESALDRYYKTGGRRGNDFSSSSSTESRCLCPECTQAEKRKQKNRHKRYY